MIIKEGKTLEHWYAAYTKSNFEKKVYDNLILKGFEAYCPLQKHISLWSDRKKIIWKPVLRSYVLVKSGVRDFEEIKCANGIVNFVYYNGKPGVIRDEEIQLMKRFLDDFKDETISVGPIQVGDDVSIASGPFMNYGGIVVDVDKKTVKILLHVLNAQLEVKTTIDKINKLQDRLSLK
jgi:Transcription antiterminator